MFTPVRDGRPQSRIHIARWAGEPERFAAEELSRYLEKITGAKLLVEVGLKRLAAGAIIIADVSHPATASLLPKGIGEGLKLDGFCIRNVKGRLYIVSSEPGGVGFGVYEYLRRFCGCAFLDVGPRGETVPRTPTVRHRDANVLDNPATWYRSQQASSNEDGEKLALRVDWMAKNGFTHLLVRLGPTAEPLAERVLPAMKRRGLKLALGHHIFSRLVPTDQFFSEHPEYFALRDGERKDRAWQLKWCLSNDDLIESVCRNAIELARQFPDADLLSLWPDDGWGGLCECPDCEELDRPEDDNDTDWDNLHATDWGYGRRGDRRKMRRYLYLANRVAERLGQAYPKLKLSILAYVDLVDPPLREVEVHPNLIVYLALYWRCSKHVLTDPKCHLNRQFVSTIEDWLKAISPDRLCFYSYEMGMSRWHSLPFPVLTSLESDWAWFRKLGLGGTHIQSFTDNVGVYGMNYLAVSRFAREHPPSLDEYIDDYCQAFFGPAAKPMATLCRLWEKCMVNARAPEVRPTPVLYLAKIFSPAAVRESRRLCDEALNLTDDALERSRVQRVRGLVDYVDLYRRVPKAIAESIEEPAPVATKHREAVACWIHQLRDLVQAHIALDDNIFRGDFTVALARRFLGEES